MARDLLPALLEQDPGPERDGRRDCEDRGGTAQAHLLRGGSFRMAHRFCLGTRRRAGRVVPGQAAPRSVDQEDARDPESGDQHRCRLEVPWKVRRGQLRAHDHDREHGDDEQPFEPEHE